MGYIGTFPRNTTAVMGIPTGKLNQIFTIINNFLSGFTYQATEVPNGSITVFTFPGAQVQPSFIVVDYAQKPAIAKNENVNWTWNQGTKQATLQTPAAEDIFAIK